MNQLGNLEFKWIQIKHQKLMGFLVTMFGIPPTFFPTLAALDILIILPSEAWSNTSSCLQQLCHITISRHHFRPTHLVTGFKFSMQNLSFGEAAQPCVHDPSIVRFSAPRLQCDHVRVSRPKGFTMISRAEKRDGKTRFQEKTS